jgi:hypothetical protein
MHLSDAIEELVTGFLRGTISEAEMLQKDFLQPDETRVIPFMTNCRERWNQIRPSVLASLSQLSQSVVGDEAVQILKKFNFRVMESVDSSTPKDVKDMVRTLGLPGGKDAYTHSNGHSWSKRGGYADSILKRVHTSAKAAGFTPSHESSSSPDGGYVRGGTHYTSPDGQWKLSTSSGYGNTAHDNYHSVELKRTKPTSESIGRSVRQPTLTQPINRGLKQQAFASGNYTGQPPVVGMDRLPTASNESDVSMDMHKALTSRGFTRTRSEPSGRYFYNHSNGVHHLTTKPNGDWRLSVRTKTDESPMPTSGTGVDSLVSHLNSRGIKETFENPKSCPKCGSTSTVAAPAYADSGASRTDKARVCQSCGNFFDLRPSPRSEAVSPPFPSSSSTSTSRPKRYNNNLERTSFNRPLVNSRSSGHRNHSLESRTEELLSLSAKAIQHEGLGASLISPRTSGRHYTHFRNDNYNPEGRLVSLPLMNSLQGRNSNRSEGRSIDPEHFYSQTAEGPHANCTQCGSSNTIPSPSFGNFEDWHGRKCNDCGHDFDVPWDHKEREKVVHNKQVNMKDRNLMSMMGVRWDEATARRFYKIAESRYLAGKCVACGVNDINEDNLYGPNQIFRARFGDDTTKNPMSPLYVNQDPSKALSHAKPTDAHGDSQDKTGPTDPKGHKQEESWIPDGFCSNCAAEVHEDVAESLINFFDTTGHVVIQG